MSRTEAKSIHSTLSWAIITIDKIIDICNDAVDHRDLPTEFGEAYRALPFIRAALQKAGSEVEPELGNGPESLQDAMDHAKRCQQNSLRLEAMFRRVALKAGVPRLKHPPISRMDQYRMALDTYGDDYEVISLLKMILEDAQELGKNFLKEAEADLQILVHIQQKLQALTPSIPKGRRNSQVALSNWGSGTSNANMSSGSQYNNADHGKQFNATTQIFGPLDARSQDPLDVLRQETEACLSSLRYENLYTRRDKLEEEKAHEGTCDWLFESSQFRKWRHRHDLRAHNGVLWIKGHPGTGKSTLMMHNMTYCEKEFKDHVICAHFFSARGDSDEKSPLGLWRSLVYQMLKKEPLLYERLVPLFRRKQSKVWTEDELRKFLRSEMISPQPRPLLFLIDALDECDDYSAGRVVDFLGQLSALAVRSNIDLKICLSSRYYPEIGLDKCIDLFVDQRKEHDEDIMRYVHDKVPSDLSSIQEDIIKKANGVFLWVVLVIAILKKKQDAGRPEEIQDLVDRAPSGLDELFENILNKDESNKAETILMFQLVLFAKRLLKPEELYFATIAGTQQERLGPWDQSVITDNAIRLRILDSSRGLIEVLRSSNTVQFIHSSISDFLSRKNRLHNLAILPHREKDSSSGLGKRAVVPASVGWWSRWTSFSNPTMPVEENVSTRQPDVVGSSNNSITECCINYLKKTAQSPPGSNAELKKLAKEHPFLEYSSTYILHHAEDAEPKGPVQEAVVNWFFDATAFETFRSIHNGFEEEQGLHCYTGASLIHTLAFHGHRNLLKLLLRKKVDINTQFGFMNSAIQIASERGDTAMVSILLEHGANPNLQGGIYGNALQAASKEEHREVIALLLNNGARINAQGGIYGTALQASAKEGHVETVRLLLENGADVDVRAGQWGTALQAACYGGNHEVATILLDCSADPHAKCGYLGTALQAAAARDMVDFVEVLIEKGVDVNARGGLYGSALQAATKYSFEATHLLLQNGADVNVHGGLRGSIIHSATLEYTEMERLILDNSSFPDIQGETRGEKINFLNAARKGEVETVEQMIKNGQDINLQGGLLGSALQAASWSGHIRMVETLLELGADVNLQGGTYGTALQAASARKRYGIVRMLVENGADANAQGGLFGNALQAAASSGSWEVVEYLVGNGANVNAEGGHWGTALQAASPARGREEIVSLLLKNGADVQKQGGVYGTALQAASREGHEEVVKILLEEGADVNAQGGHWNTALQGASRDEGAIAEMLLRHGADVSLRGGAYGTALNAAAVDNQRGIMDLLIRHGADPNAYIWVWPRSSRWRVALWRSQGTEWRSASGIIMSLCVLSFAGWRLWKRLTVLS